MLSHFKSRSLVGLDMNAEEIRLLQLRRFHKGFFVENFARKALPPGAMQDGKIMAADQVTAVLKALVQQTGTLNEVAALAIPARRVISKRITLTAALSDDEYEETITANFAHYFPGLREAVCFDYVVNQAKPSEVLLVASRFEQLNQYLCVVQEAGLQIKIVDVDTYALARAASLFPEPVIAVLDFGLEATQFVLLQHQQIIFSQYWHATESNQLATEIHRAIQWCQASHPELQLQTCLVSGESPIAATIYSENKSLRFEKANPLAALFLSPQINLRELQCAANKLMVCCGLAMRRMPTW